MRAWLQLLRIALAPSVIWDAIAGSLIATAVLQHRFTEAAAESGASAATPPRLELATLGATIAVLLCVFHAGMAWNDWRDRAIDQEAGRKRPLADGRISAQAGFLAGAVLFALGLGLAALFLPERLDTVAILCGIVALYDLGGKALRAVAGPVLLALCRILSLGLGMLVVLEPVDIAKTSALGGLLAYGLYLLFLARLAANEEEGLPGPKAIVPVAACAFAPVVFPYFDQGSLTLFVPAWLLFAAWLVRPALRDRHIVWSPTRVQSAVRRCLMGMPLIPALALLSGTAPAWWAAGGLLTMGVSRVLVRRFPPE